MLGVKGVASALIGVVIAGCRIRLGPVARHRPLDTIFGRVKAVALADSILIMLVYDLTSPMTDAYVHVYVEPSAIQRAAEAIDAVDAVEATHMVTGEHDIVARLSVPKEEIAQVVTEELLPVSGVLETETNVAFEV